MGHNFKVKCQGERYASASPLCYVVQNRFEGENYSCVRQFRDKRMFCSFVHSSELKLVTIPIPNSMRAIYIAIMMQFCYFCRAYSLNLPKPQGVRHNLREVREEKSQRQALQVLQSGRRHLKGSSKGDDDDGHGDDERD